MTAYGYIIYLTDADYRFKRAKQVSLIRTQDQWDVLRLQQTDGINYDITTDSLITLLKQFDKKYSIRVLGAGLDWCEFSIEEEPVDWMALAREVYAICPDVVDQGTGTVEELAREMNANNRLFLWWD
jgi:hypothetical protein